MDNLPGYPDGLTEGSEGSYWLSLVTLNSPALELFLKSRYATVLVRYTKVHFLDQET